MLQLGMEWLKQHPEFSFKKQYKSLQGVFGVCFAETEEAKSLDDAMMDDQKLKECGVTGAMHQCVVGHLIYISRFGYDSWLEEIGQHREPEECFEFDGTEASCPPTWCRHER